MVWGQTLVLDALEVKCREGGRTVNACVVHAVAVNLDRVRERSDRPGPFLEDLTARANGGVKIVACASIRDCPLKRRLRAAIMRSRVSAGSRRVTNPTQPNAAPAR